MDEDHSGLPFACLPAHGLSYTELPGHGSMPFGRSPLLCAGQAGAQLPSQRSEAPADEPAESTAPYAEDTYQEADKEVSHCCTRPRAQATGCMNSMRSSPSYSCTWRAGQRRSPI